MDTESQVHRAPCFEQQLQAGLSDLVAVDGETDGMARNSKLQTDEQIGNDLRQSHPKGQQVQGTSFAGARQTWLAGGNDTNRERCRQLVHGWS